MRQHHPDPAPGRHIRVAKLEDIVAEKLRALLQQPVRNRYRGQDVLDLAVILRGDHVLDAGKVRDYLIATCDARGIALARDAFASDDVRLRALQSYANLESTTRHAFVPFAPAFESILALVESLDVPGQG